MRLQRTVDLGLIVQWHQSWKTVLVGLDDEHSLCCAWSKVVYASQGSYVSLKYIQSSAITR